jgi:hypothetical protein
MEKSWEDFNNDLLRFVGFFYATTIAVLFRVLIRIDYTKGKISFSFDAHPVTVVLLLLIVWDFISTTFYVRTVKYNPPAYIEFVIHIIQVSCLAFAVLFSLAPSTISPNVKAWEMSYFWVAIYCALMLVWNAAYFYRNKFVVSFFKLLELDRRAYQPFKYLALIKGFFLPLFVVIPTLMFSSAIWPRPFPILEAFALAYAILRVMVDIVAMHFLWKGRTRHTTVVSRGAHRA